MTRLNPTQAAEQWKIGKSTLYRAMNSGELSFTNDDSGKRFIDTSELLRVYGEPNKSQGESVSGSESVLVHTLREIIERQDKSHSDHIKSLQSQVDSYQEQMNKLLENQADTTKLLLHLQDSIENKPAKSVEVVEPLQAQETPAQEPVQQPAKRKKSLFGRLLAAAIED